MNLNPAVWPFSFPPPEVVHENATPAVVSLESNALDHLRPMTPFNLSLLKLTPERLEHVRPVTSVDYYENVKGDLHEDGLFSIPIFGRIGSPDRDRRFSYIDIKTEILHPVIYDRITRVRAMYREIMAGKLYARWNPDIGDFEAANELEGRTGYSFFIEHWRHIKFARNASDVRDMRLNLLEKYADVALTSKIIVIPAGLRDIEVDETGRTNVGEINTLYRQIISISSVIPNHDGVKNDPMHDLSRQLLQQRFNEVYAILENMLSGKEGFLQSKWASRAVFNSTRNVITAMETSVPVLGAVNAPKFTDTIVGLWQLSKAVLPVTLHALRTGYLKDVFNYGGRIARLVDPTTMDVEMVDVSADAHDRWNTVEGLEKVVASYKELTLRDKPITIDGRYLALIYAPADKKVFRVFSDINELPEGFDRKDVRPINLMELLYLSGYRVWNNQVGLVTRYPVTNVGSCYPTTVYVKTTVVGEVRRELGPDWQPLTDDDSSLASEFPTYSPLAYQDSLVISSVRLAGLGADDLQRVLRVSPTRSRGRVSNSSNCWKPSNHWKLQRGAKVRA